MDIYLLTRPWIDSDLRFRLLCTQIRSAISDLLKTRNINYMLRAFLPFPLASRLRQYISSYLRDPFPKFIRNNPTDPELITDHGLRRLREGEIQAAVTVTSLSQSEGRNSQPTVDFTKSATDSDKYDMQM